jgi:RNase P subunit RPR2
MITKRIVCKKCEYVIDISWFKLLYQKSSGDGIMSISADVECPTCNDYSEYQLNMNLLEYE